MSATPRPLSPSQIAEVTDPNAGLVMLVFSPLHWRVMEGVAKLQSHGPYFFLDPPACRGSLEGGTMPFSRM